MEIPMNGSFLPQVGYKFTLSPEDRTTILKECHHTALAVREYVGGRRGREESQREGGVLGRARVIFSKLVQAHPG